MLPNSWFKKEKPLPGVIGMGGGATGLVNSSSGLAPQIDASGGHVSDVTEPDGTIYRYHVFNSPGNFVVSDLGASDGTIQYLLVAGGGAGGKGSNAGGGGGGGVQCNMPGLTAHPNCTTSSLTLPTTGTTAVTVGRGGKMWPDGGYEQNKGYDSVFAFPPGTITANGGGGGGNYQGPTERRAGSPGGSGGGGGSNESDPSPTPTGSQGYGTANLEPGPGAQSYKYAGIGGGGAGAASLSGNARQNWNTNPWPGGAVNPTSPLLGMGSAGGAGGVVTGMPGLDATQVGVEGPTTGIWFSGGGGGGTRDGYNPTSPPGNPPTSSPNPGAGRAGGAGGGGQGSSGSGYTPGVPADGLLPKGGNCWETYPNGNPAPLKQSPGGQYGAFMTGGGGGGGGYEWGGTGGGIGGPGFGVIRYAIAAKQSGTAKATGGLIGFTPTHVIHTFLQPGTFVVDSGFSETCEYVVLGGGGCGGGAQNFRYVGGGGGAGGYLTGTTPIAHPAPLTVTVGGGGDNGSSGPWDSKWWYGGSEGAANEPARKGGYSPGRPSVVNFPAGTITAEGGGCGGVGYNWPPTRSWPEVDCDTTKSAIGSPGGSGGGTAGHNPNTMHDGGEGSKKPDDDQSPAEPGQGNDGGKAGCEDQGMGGGGGGAGGAGGDTPTNCNPPANPAPTNKAGYGGVGIRLPSTFHGPNCHTFAPGPLGDYYVAGGGAGGGYGSSAGPPSDPAPTTIPINNVVVQPGGYGGGGDANDWWGRSPNAPNLRMISPTSFGRNSCGGGGGAGIVGGGSPTPTPGFAAPGAWGGSGVVLIAYPV